MDMDRRGRHVGMAGQVLHRPEAWSDSSSAVAKEWRSVCGVTSLVRPVRVTARLKAR
jgi:hypothetical protein